MSALPNPVLTAFAASQLVRLHGDGEYGVTYRGREYADLVPVEFIDPPAEDFHAVALALALAHRLNLPS